MKKTIAFVILFTSLFISCEKEKESEDKISFTGITKTDEQGFVISEDTTDWKFNDKWIDEEINLFASQYNRNCQKTFDYKIIVFSNPNKGKFLINTKMPNTAMTEFRLVDKKFNKIISLDSIVTSDTFNSKDIAFNVNSFNKKGMLRLYYKIIENNCEFQGHGDILVE
ncbi:MAG: hypothetical protein WBB17_08160 [Saprospiraceae bacterium]|nr:hypothetical protein [Saprospiraceae bacterium]MBK7469101.1 hypothetical protein [Saprospiraceae bacterium]MBK9992679.1 hypothetical protein [Saprospiraceae bacterium]